MITSLDPLSSPIYNTEFTKLRMGNRRARGNGSSWHDHWQILRVCFSTDIIIHKSILLLSHDLHLTVVYFACLYIYFIFQKKTINMQSRSFTHMTILLTSHIIYLWFRNFALFITIICFMGTLNWPATLG